MENIYVRSGGSVLDAVKSAVKKKNKMADYAEFWCVCDVDDTDHATLVAAQALATKNDIKLCTSNRCFEVWIGLHFNFSDRAVCCERESIELVTPIYPSYGNPYKSIPFYILHEKTSDAITNALELERRKANNPSTGLAHLVRKLQQNCV